MLCDDGPLRGLGMGGGRRPTRSAECGQPRGQALSGEGQAERAKRKRMRRMGASRIERGEYTMPRALRRDPAAQRRQEREPGLRPVSYLVYLPRFVFS